MAYTEHSNPVAGGVTRGTVDPEHAWQAFSASTRVRKHRHGEHEILFYEGDPARQVFEIIEGAVMLYKLLPDGRRQLVDVLGANDVFGLPRGNLQDCNAETLTDTVVRVFDRKDTETLIEVQGHINRCLKAQVEKLHDHAVLLGRKSAFERVASFLFRFVPKCPEVECDGRSVPVKMSTLSSMVVLTMTRQEIADYLGLTIETVSRVISDFKRRGVISLERQDHIRINSICGLCRMTGAH